MTAGPHQQALGPEINDFSKSQIKAQRQTKFSYSIRKSETKKRVDWELEKQKPGYKSQAN